MVGGRASGEYWAAMNLMGRYAAANHALIHKHIAKKLGAHVILGIGVFRACTRRGSNPQPLPSEGSALSS